MLDNYSNQNTSIKTEIPYRDKYPSIVIDVVSYSVIEIPSDKGLSFLSDENMRVCINGDINFIVHKFLVGMVKQGKYRFWYSRNDPHDRYIELLMVEKID